MPDRYITRSAPFLTGGGGIDPVPDLDALVKAARRGKRVFLFAANDPGLSRSDSLQTRLWLPKIQEIIAREHPAMHRESFETETQAPFKVEVYQ